jgi:DNA primase
VASYSSRRFPGATVAMPVHWEELDESLAPAAFDLRSVPERLAKQGDAWSGFFAVTQALGATARARVRTL